MQTHCPGKYGDNRGSPAFPVFHHTQPEKCRFHQIKRMFEKVGKTVVYLKRLSMGSLELDPALPKGSARLLTQKEKAALGIADAETQKGK